jgi:FkbM family methyltransferase
LDFIYHQRPLVLDVRGQTSSDIFTFFQLFVANEYAPFFQKIRKSNIKSIIDCGANVGYFSVQVLTWFPAAKALLVEPDLDNLAQIETNLSRNNLGESCELIHGAIWPTDQYLEIYDKGGEWAYQVQPSESVSELKGFTLLKLMQTAGFDRIDLLKLDVEGTEELLFKHSLFKETLKNHVGIIVMEIHDDYATRNFIYEELDKFGFEFFDSGELTICTKK